MKAPQLSDQARDGKFRHQRVPTHQKSFGILNQKTRAYKIYLEGSVEAMELAIQIFGLIWQEFVRNIPPARATLTPKVMIRVLVCSHFLST